MNAKTYRTDAPIAAGLDLAELLWNGEIRVMAAGPDGAWTATPAHGSVARAFPTPEHVRAFADYTRHTAAQAAAEPEGEFLRRMSAKAAEITAVTQR
ncbi:hypothetical protein OG618_37820 (plasmid) [Kitasatospora sp. NBC_01246]|uniref:hypothetical protein n=1 Tax=Kitasatospora sp. NBC_01246 TaxID=2903570 RepID=UPI002E30E362|nr:hypothetical protein [Kitasatospora sp. NBC_01246]